MKPGGVSSGAVHSRFLSGNIKQNISNVYFLRVADNHFYEAQSMRLLFFQDSECDRDGHGQNMYKK
jgi:hypothetical protein